MEYGSSILERVHLPVHGNPTKVLLDVQKRIIVMERTLEEQWNYKKGQRNDGNVSKRYLEIKTKLEAMNVPNRPVKTPTNR